MSRKLMVALFLVLLLSLTVASAEGVTVTDATGREVTLAEPATRIVALTPADCEILCALGCEEALIGRGEYCTYPESIQALPSVQSGAETNIEEILALEPDVLLMTHMAETDRMIDTLAQNGVQSVVSSANTIEDVYANIRMIGTLMGKDAEAEALIADMQAAFDGIRAQAEETGKTVFFEVSPLEWGLWAAGSNTFMDEIATMCGLTNVFADVEGWAAVSEEQVLERNPDYIITVELYTGEGLTPVEKILSRTGWEEVAAIQNEAVLNADSNAISLPGPRLKDAALELFNFFYAITEPAA